MPCPFVLKIASCSLSAVVIANASKSGAGMASSSRKHTAVLHDDQLEHLLQSESEQSLSDSDGDTEDELEDLALIHNVITEGSDEDDSTKQDFVWESMENYEG
jgi:hypothetical protein